MRVKK